MNILIKEQVRNLIRENNIKTVNDVTTNLKNILGCITRSIRGRYISRTTWRDKKGKKVVFQYIQNYTLDEFLKVYY